MNKMAIIKLTQGYEAIIDDNLIEKLSKFKYHAKVSIICGNTYVYAARWSKGSYPTRYCIPLHYDILGIEPKDNRGLCVDHINRNTLDNRILNLRIATKSENALNSKREKTGVYFDICKRRWKAFLQEPGQKKRKHLGSLKTREEAVKAYEAHQ